MSAWWIDEPHLLGSSNPSAADLEQYQRDGFTVLVSLLQEDEQAPNYDLVMAESLGFQRHNVAVKDFDPPSIEQLTHFVKLVDSVSPARVLVHCLGGVGRTGTFAAAYWIARGMDTTDAIAHVRKARPGAVETREQMMALAEFERCLGSAG